MKTLVLMSVYNGEKYLSEQIDSILKQDSEHVDLLIRDDGSNDNTEKIISKYVEQTDRIRYMKENNCGTWKSFMELMYVADTTYDYYAFADQDDVWLPEKISTAVEILQRMSNHNENVPLLYGGNIHVVDENLKDIDTGITLTNYVPTFGSALIQGITSGLTCVFNQALLLKVKLEEKPEFMIMHDWWIYLIASCYGKVYYDDRSYVLYRQHGNNVCGARTGRLERMKYRISHFSERRASVLRQTEEFVRCHKDMPEDKRKMAELLCDSKKSMIKRLKLVFNRDITRQRRGDNIIYKTLVLLGYL